MSVATLDQRMSALERANVIRIARAQIKREIRAGQLTVAEALRDERAEGLTIGALIGAQHCWGPTRTAQYLGRHHISPHRRVRSLTERQRGVIGGELG